MKALLVVSAAASIGIGTAYITAPAPALPSKPADAAPWTPTRNTIGKVGPMAADELDRQQPDEAAPNPARPRVRTVAATGPAWSYRGCREARAAGATPLYRGQPGYGAHMDGDGDGIACEDY